MTKCNKDEKDWIGRRFHKGVVIKKLGEKEVLQPKNKATGHQSKTIFDVLLLKCDCGNEYVRNTKSLVNSGINRCPKSCGCHIKEDLTGQIFGYGTIQKFSHNKMVGVKSPRSIAVWEVLCKCGNTYYGTSPELKRCIPASCGCSRNFYHTLIIPKSLTEWWRVLRTNARIRGKEFTITKQDCLDQIKKQNYKCMVSGESIKIEAGTASIDRIDSDIGYIKSNIQFIYRPFNYMKGILSQKEFIRLCTQVADYQRE